MVEITARMKRMREKNYLKYLLLINKAEKERVQKEKQKERIALAKLKRRERYEKYKSGANDLFKKMINENPKIKERIINASDKQKRFMDEFHKRRKQNEN